MPSRPAISLLPDEIRAQLDSRLINNGFSCYEQLEEWLESVGFSIGKSQIHRYGEKLERKLQAIRASTQAAAAIAEAAPDDADLRSSAVISLVQTDIFDVLVTLQEAEQADAEGRLKLLARAAHSIADLSRASVSQKKWMTEVRTKVRSVADKAAAIARKGGVPLELEEELRRQILGIAS